MFSLARPSPAMKCASSSSLSYSVRAVARVGQAVVHSPVERSLADQAPLPLSDVGAGMRDVVQEGVAGAHAPPWELTGAAGFPSTTTSSAVSGMPSAPMPTMSCGIAVRTGNEVAVLHRCAISGTLPTSKSVSSIPSMSRRLRLDVGPGRHAAAIAPPSSRCAGGDRTCHAAFELIFAQEHLLRRMRGIGLVLVDERRGGVRVASGAVIVVRLPMMPSAPGRRVARRQHHVIRGAAGDVERIVRLQRDVDRAVAALGDEIEAVVEELAEQRDPGVERRRQAFVGRDVRQVDGVAVHRDAEGSSAGVAHITCRSEGRPQ